jgi:hypothetical protein
MRKLTSGADEVRSVDDGARFSKQNDNQQTGFFILPFLIRHLPWTTAKYDTVISGSSLCYRQTSRAEKGAECSLGFKAQNVIKFRYEYGQVVILETSSPSSLTIVNPVAGLVTGLHTRSGTLLTTLPTLRK